VPKFSIDFKEIILFALGNFEEQNEILEFSINYYYSIIILAKFNYFYPVA
jgi:hypothetical protein